MGSIKEKRCKNCGKVIPLSQDLCRKCEGEEKEKEARKKLDKISKCNRKRDGRADFLEGYRKCREDVVKLIDEVLAHHVELKEFYYFIEELKSKIEGK